MLEADLQREYQADLCDVWRGTLSLRKLRVFIEHLPADSASARAIADVTGPLSQWSLTDALLGRLVDELAAYRWQWESAHIDTKRTSLRRQPESVMPRVERKQLNSGDGADVIPLLSPHKLGGFVDNDPKGDR